MDPPVIANHPLFIGCEDFDLHILQGDNSLIETETIRWVFQDGSNQTNSKVPRAYGVDIDMAIWL